jgi:hypothetical protein
MPELNVGTEYRDERSRTNPDEQLQAADLSDLGAVISTGGGVIYHEGLMEARMPLIADGPLAEQLNFEIGDRHSSYDLGFKTKTWKIGLSRTQQKMCDCMPVA